MLEEMEAMKQKNKELKEVNECLKAKEDEITSDNVQLNSELSEEKCNVAEVYIPQMVQVFFPRSSSGRSTQGNSKIDFFNPDPPNNYFLLHF